MSFLAWVFAIGGLTVAFPILFHLIRPTPRGRLKFGSLMFLRQSPPRITRRSRIDNWLLLLLRGLAILLITAAFMRPFLRSTSGMIFGDLPGRQIAILIDTSASMQRDGVWQKAIDRARRTLDECQPGDQVALFQFASQMQEIVPFPAAQAPDFATRKALISEQLKALQPGNLDTRLGDALMSVARLMTESPHQSSADVVRQILLVSDFQSGAELTELQGEEWPDNILVEFANIQPTQPTNATVRLASDQQGLIESSLNEPRVRVFNNANSQLDQFRVAWTDSDGTPPDSGWVSFYVPAGKSQVLPVPRPADVNASQLVLVGDDCPFDNSRFVSLNRQQELTIDWLGEPDPDDAESAFYFLSRVFPETPGRKVSVTTRQSASYPVGSESELPQLVVVNRHLSAAETAEISRYVSGGGTALVVPNDQQMLASVQPLLGTVQPVAESEPQSDSSGPEYLMLTNIDFAHPVFAALSGARYNDFSKIRFWKSIPLQEAADSNIKPLAHFDNGNLAVWENRMDQGTVIGMASGWEPGSSQLALSSRFLPLMWSILQLSRRAESPGQQYEVGSRLALPQAGGDRWRLQQPDGQEIELTRSEPADHMLDQTGIYSLSDGKSAIEVAVNLANNESLTSPIPLERLEALGVKQGSSPNPGKWASDLRKMSEIQMEGRQRIWKWLILAALVLLLVETALAGRRGEAGPGIEVSSA